MSMLLTFLLLSACSTPQPQDWWACEDDACRSQELEQAWGADSTRLLSGIGELPSLEQEILVRVLVQTHARDVAAICGGLVAGTPGSERCRRMHLRPHLVMGQHREPPEPPPRPGGGPPTTGLPVPAPSLQGWPNAPDLQELDKLVSSCQDDSQCIGTAVHQAASSGRAQLAAGLCEARYATQPEFEWECNFDAAELLLQHHGAPRAADALRLCAVSGSFAKGCTHHVVGASVPLAEASDVPTTAGIAVATDALGHIQQAVGERDSATWTDAYWSVWTYRSFMSAHSVTGSLSDMLPSEAMPHVRVAAAYRLLRTHPEAWSQDLEDLRDLLQQRLARREAPTSPDSADLPQHGRLKSFWMHDFPGEEFIPAASCLDSSRRPISEDPALDSALALLEAAGRVEPPPPAPWLKDIVLSERDPLLRWTAARVLQKLHADQAPSISLEGLPRLVAGRLQARHLFPGGPDPDSFSLPEGGGSVGPRKPPL